MAGHDDGRLPPGPGAAALWRHAGRGFGRLFQAAPRFEYRETSSASLALSGVAVPDLNCGVIDGGGDAAERVAEMAGHLRRRLVPGLLLVADEAGSAARRAAEAAGAVLAARMPLMSLAAGDLGRQDGGFAVREVADVTDLAAANRVMAAAFDVPVGLIGEAFAPSLLAATDVRVEPALDGDEPVGALQTTVAGDVTGVWSMATLPAHRRRGVGRAGLCHALKRRFREGCSTAYLVATDSGRPLYDAVGFGVVAWCDVWFVAGAPEGG